MTRRMEIELTSQVDEHQWTWRAAGARQPKGVVESSVVPTSAKVGDVLRAEYESNLDGIDIVALQAPKGKEEPKALQRIELAPREMHGPEISVTYAPKGGGRSGQKGDRKRGPGRDGDGGERKGRREGAPRGERPAGAGAGTRPPRGADGDRSGSRPSGNRGPGGRPGSRGPRDQELPTSTVHRNALLATLGPEQLPIAEQLLRGGIPAVRQAITEQDTKAKSAGTPAADSQAILAIADALLPQTSLAAWKDRAAAVEAAGKEVRLRELRTVVTAARTVTMDDEGRAMLKTMKEQLDQRINAMTERWVTKITTALDEGKIVEALTTVSQPPDQGTRCPAELAVRLADAAGAALTAETAPADWLTLLQAVTETPVRRNVVPAGIPDDEDVKAAARSAAGLVPALAKLLGLRIPPPPPRRTVVRRAVTTD